MLLHTIEGSSKIDSVAINSNTIVAGCMNGTIKVWDLLTKNLLHEIKGHWRVYSACEQE